MLHREVFRRSSTPRIVLSAAVISLVIGGALLVAPRTICRLGASKVEVARTTATRYAHDAYPRWRTGHPDQTCPHELDELNVYTNHHDAIDPWGHHYRFTCDPTRGMWVMSAGEDGKPGTADDIWSRR